MGKFKGDSIEYLSSSWTNIFKTGNDTDQDSLDLFRQFHCADCLKSFQQQQQQADKQNSIKKDSSTNSKHNSTPSNHQAQKNYTKNNTKAKKDRLQMNTPPPPLQPITDEAKNGLYHYFGQQNQQYPVQHSLPLSNSFSNVNHFVNMSVNQNSSDELKLMPNLTQIGSNLQNAQQQNSYSPFMSSNLQMTNSTGDSELNFNEDNNLLSDEDDRMSESSIQEKGQNLSRKLAQRRPKQELIECGILPRSRVSMLHHNRMVDLKKAQLQDILKTKIEKRPNRDTLIQKNILPDSAPHAAPSLIRKCTELKRARLADDLNDKLAKRPGPLELVESGILVSSDSALSDAIKDGKIQYPRTSTYIQQLEQQVNYDQNIFNIDDSSLNYLNFNFNNLTDEDSNSSTSTTKTSNTIASSTSVAPSSTAMSNTNANVTASSLFQTNQSSPQQSILPQTDVINFNDLFQSTVPSPNNQPLTKISPSNSPYNAGAGVQNFDFLPSAQDKPALKSQMSKNKSKSFSSGSSVASNGSSSSSKTGRSSRNNSQGSNGPGSNGSSSNGSQYTRKLSQLIFHEYRGPNQKSSKSSISLKTNISLKKNTNNVVNAFNFQKSNLVVNNSNSNGTNSTNTNEIFFDDSNDSTNNLNSAIVNIGSVSEALNPHKIRIKQQKIFLKYNSSKSRDSSNNDNANNIEQTITKSSKTNRNSKLIDEKLEMSNQMNGMNIENNQMDVLMPDPQGDQEPISLQNQTQVNIAPQANSNQQSIQLVSINDLQSLDNLQNIFQTNFLPVNSITVASSDLLNSERVVNTPPLTQPSVSMDTTNPSLAMPCSNIGTEQAVNSNKQNSNISSNQINQPMSNQSKSSTKNESIKTEPNQCNLSAKTNIEEMSLNELKEECRRRKLLVTGNKQKLIDRIKSNTHLNVPNQISSIKSPDSGVNMDSSPSITSIDQSPCNSINSANLISNQKSKSNVQKLAANNEVMSQEPTHQKIAAKTSSSLDDFFNFLDIENLGTNNESKSGKKDSKNKTLAKKEMSSENELSSLSNNLNQMQKHISSGLENKNPDNLSETKATLEMSLKNSAELLKQLSSIGQIEHMHQLENQMKESMQLIEKLKSASSSQQIINPVEMTSECKTPGPGNFFETINNYPNKLKTVTSIPSDLKKIGSMNQHAANGDQNFQQANSVNLQYTSQIQINNNSNIPSNKNTFNLYQNQDVNMKQQSISNNDNNDAQAVYQFDNLMKELTTTNLINEIDNTNRPVVFPSQENENSIENDLIMNKKLIEQQKLLPSIGSLITQNQTLEIQNKQGTDHQQYVSETQDTKPMNTFNNQFSSNSCQNDMEWNDTEFLKLCEELDNANSLFGKIDQKVSAHKTNDLLIHGNTSGYILENQNQMNNDQNSYVNQNSQLMYNGHQGNLNFGALGNEHQVNQSNTMPDQFVNSQSQLSHGLANIQNTIGSANEHNNGTIMMPWEFDNDLNQIVTYLQSPTV